MQQYSQTTMSEGVDCKGEGVTITSVSRQDAAVNKTFHMLYKNAYRITSGQQTLYLYFHANCGIFEKSG